MTAVAGGSLVELVDAVFGYSGRAVVRVESLTLGRGRCLGVFGHNGSGKTTLVRGILGLILPMSGRVARPAGAPTFGFISQYRGIDLAWPMSGFDAAALAVSGRQRFGWVSGKAKAAVHREMRRMGVLDLARRPFAALSGGQQQRLLLAGALAAGPDVLVLDEPTDGLDVASRARLLATLNELKRDGLAVVIISHDPGDLLAVSDAVACLQPGADAESPTTVDCVSPADLADRYLSAGRR